MARIDGTMSTTAFPDNRMDRRTAMRYIAALAGGLIGLAAWPAATGIRQRIDNYDPYLKIDTDGKLDLNFDEVAQLAKRLDHCFDQLPEPQIEFNNEVLAGLAVELIPQFQYEGITPKSEWPKDVKFVFFMEGDDANHVLGRSDCETYAIVNGRLELPLSTFGKGDAPFTLAHELAHVAQTQSICGSFSSEEIESSAQIGALEVTAGLANQGNPFWLWATLDELRGMSISAAYGLALVDGDFEKFHGLRKQLSPGATSEARFQKSRRRWSEDPFELSDMLNKYNTKPLNRIGYAVRYNNAEITDLAFPPVYEGLAYWSSQRSPQPVKLDDLSYLLQHMEAMVEEVSGVK